MKKGSKFLVCILVIFSFIILFKINSVYAYYPTPSIEQITYGTEMNRNPTIDKHNLIYEKYVNGKWRIFRYNINTGNEEQLVNTCSVFQHYPKIDNNFLIYTDKCYQNLDEVWLMNVGAKDVDYIDVGENPDIYQNTVYYKKLSDAGNIAIFSYQIGSGKTEQITDDPYAYYLSLSVDGNYIVADAFGPGYTSTEIILIDIINKSSTRISYGGGASIYPKISDGRVVWEDWRSGNANVYYYDIRKGHEEYLLGEPGGNQERPDIYKDRFVYQNNHATDIKSYDLSNNEVSTIFSGAYTSQIFPTIYKDTIAWVGVDSNNIHQLYLYK